MKTLKQTAAIFFGLIIFSSAVSAQWVNRSIEFPDEVIAWSIDSVDSLNAIVSFSQFIYKTENGGESWELISLNPDIYESAQDISMIDADNFWVGTDHGRIYKLTNASQIGTLQYNDTSKTKFINYIEMFDLNNGIAMGDADQFSEGIPVFLKTTDGGLNWVSTTDTAIGGWSGDIWRRMDFVDENLGYFYESGNSPQKLYKTTNGGLNWNETNFTKFPMILKFYDMNFGLIYSPNFADSTKEINRTTDGGLTWESFTVSMTGWGNDIEFVRGDPSKVWFTDWLGLYFSSDSGKTWTEEKLSDSELKGRDIVFTDDNSGWLICDNGKIYRTTNTETGVTALETEKVIGSSYKLMQNYPNPFNPETTINYQLPFSSYVTLKVYDALGKEITTLVNEFKTAGEYQIKFRSSISSGISSGVYFYRLKTNDFIEIKKMLLLK